MTNEPVFCCLGFQYLVENAAERGLSAIVVRYVDTLAFNLQSRGVADRDVAALKYPTVDINIATNTGLEYCPFCGTKLELLILRNHKIFEALAEKHRTLTD